MCTNGGGGDTLVFWISIIMVDCSGEELTVAFCTVVLVLAAFPFVSRGLGPFVTSISSSSSTDSIASSPALSA